MTALSGSLIRPLYSGPLDIVGDVHGEIEGLRTLIDKLGYDGLGRHPEGRRLVFVGDLIDKGPDSPAVLRLVRSMIEADLAQAVMGNHELNLLVGKVRRYNHWYHGTNDTDHYAAATQILLPKQDRAWVKSFLASLPLALVRSDLRVTHACWDPVMTPRLAEENDPVALYSKNERVINERLDAASIRDDTDRNLATQNGCPVRVTTSGPEERAAVPFHAGGRIRYEARSPWWQRYDDSAFCVFGHYSRTSPHSQNGGGLPLFPDDATAPVGSTMCIDLGVGARVDQRHGAHGDEQLVLAAFRWPERTVVTDEPYKVQSRVKGQ